MSGIYALVRAIDDDDAGQVKELFRTMTHGWPHITILYEGTSTSDSSFLTEVAATTLQELALHRVFIDHAKVNEFVEERTGRMRYDVLLMLGPVSASLIDDTRDLLTNEHPWTRCTTKREPHITHSTHYNKQDAEAALVAVQPKLPITVQVAGIAITPLS